MSQASLRCFWQGPLPYSFRQFIAINLIIHYLASSLVYLFEKSVLTGLILSAACDLFSDYSIVNTLSFQRQRHGKQ